MRALNIAATGMLAQETNVAVISNNIANMRTTGYKRQRADFADLYYQNLTRVGSQTSDSGTLVPAGVQLGSGVRIVATPRVMSQGELERTDNDTDIAIRGEGYLRIELPNGQVGYTRDGSLEIAADGTLVTQEGFAVVPRIVVPADARDIAVSEQGAVQARVGDTSQVLGQIQLTTFVNKAGLEAIGDNLFLETEASGAGRAGNPGDPSYGTVLQFHLEAANVVAVSELSNLIAAQRAYEMNSRIIRAADEMLSATSNMT